jgi:hypothetical protein
MDTDADRAAEPQPNGEVCPQISGMWIVNGKSWKIFSLDVK